MNFNIQTIRNAGQRIRQQIKRKSWEIKDNDNDAAKIQDKLISAFGLSQ